MKSFTAAAVLALGAAVSAAPATMLSERSDICGQWDSTVTGDYTLYQDLWNMNAGSGSQCSGVDSHSGTNVAWHTKWNWSGGQGQVKSYANIKLTANSEKLSSISSIPTTWKYSYSGSDLVADVSYDLFTSSTASGSNEYEIMIWLAALGGAGPISSTGSAIATLKIDNVAWKLYSGPNGATTVYSFVASKEVTNFSGDLKEFFTYLINHKYIASSQYLTSLGAGTEPFSGSNAVMTTTQFSVQIK
ncbi:hypothetical protein AAFC00_000207 [Neodothiora populina]|uniref:Uncharacterized protein n=1 Tax=Neodothiora populina TaxID=2781224 RepID=A0ABR3P2J6_9PEZI